MDERKENAPFLLRPAVKDYLWGGTRLKTEYNKRYDIAPLAETWECSAHPDGPSVVASGAYEGVPLPELLRRRPEYLGARYAGGGGLPILVKLIDAARDLSVQVHPDDAFAARYENGSLGKTELWYVLDAAPGARIVYGLRRGATAEELRRAIGDGTLEGLLNYVPVRAGDSFLIRAGTIHAIGAGVIVAEIQESSNLTYRLYDYNRRGRDGRLRELHVDKALRVARLEPEPRSAAPADGWLGGCEYFRVRRTSGGAVVRGRADSFTVLLCIDGAAGLESGSGRLALEKGGCAFVPALSGDVRLDGMAELLEIVC